MPAYMYVRRMILVSLSRHTPTAEVGGSDNFSVGRCDGVSGLRRYAMMLAQGEWVYIVR